MLFRSFHSSATTSSGFPGYFWDTLIMIRSGEFRESFLISWCLHVSYNKEEFDNTARYHNHKMKQAALSSSVSMTEKKRAQQGKKIFRMKNRTSY